MKQKLIEFFENTLPKELQLPIPENLSEENKKRHEELKQFLFGEAALNYFNTYIRPVLEKQIEMLELNENISFERDFVYASEVLMKYLNMLDDSDPLRIRFNKSDCAKPVSSLKDFGLI
jgi:hypothetical protein